MAIDWSKPLELNSSPFRVYTVRPLPQGRHQLYYPVKWTTGSGDVIFGMAHSETGEVIAVSHQGRTTPNNKLKVQNKKDEPDVRWFAPPSIRYDDESKLFVYDEPT